MGTPLTVQINSIIHAYQEGMVVAVIRLYESGVLGSDPAKTMRDNIMNYLTEEHRGLGMATSDARCWLDHFHIDK